MDRWPQSPGARGRAARGQWARGSLAASSTQAIADFQGMQFQYARAAAEIEAARVLVYNACRLKEGGQPFVQEAAMAKLLATEARPFPVTLATMQRKTI